MKTKVKKFKGGEINYRLPNVIESMRLIGKMGVDSSGESSKNELEMYADMLEGLEPFINEIKLEAKAVSWDEALFDRRIAAPLSDIATEIMESVNQAGEERKTRKKA